MNTSVGRGCLAIPNDVAAGFCAAINATVAEVGEFVALGVRVVMVLFQCQDNDEICTRKRFFESWHRLPKVCSLFIHVALVQSYAIYANICYNAKLHFVLSPV